MFIQQIIHAAHELPEKDAIIYGDHHITYGQLEEITNRLVNGLRASGIQVGDRVVLLMPNLPHFIFSYYALLKLGAVVVPLNYMMEDNEIVGVIKSVEPRAIIYWHGFRQHIQSFLPSSKNPVMLIVLGGKAAFDHYDLLDLIAHSVPEPVTDVFRTEAAVIQFTSGVTELPHGIEFNHDNITASIESCSNFFRFNESDVFGAILPLFFIFSQNALLNGALSHGATVVLHAKVAYETISRSIREHKITVMAGSPNLYRQLLAHAAENLKNSALKFCLSSWHPLERELSAQFEQQVGGPLLNCYAITESGGLVAANHPSIERRDDSVGLALPDVDIQVHDQEGLPLDPNMIGEIAIQSKAVGQRYWNHPELTAERFKNHWYYTGDLGKIDEQGYIHLVNKKAEVIVKSGFPIYTIEIEQLLSHHPKIREVAVIATPHPDHKQDVKACIVLKGNESATATEIFEYCKSQLPVYKCPQIIQFYHELPRTRMGRIFKRKLLQNSTGATGQGH